MADKKKKADDGDEKKGMGTKLKPILMIVAAGAAYKFVLAPKPAATTASVVVAAAEKPVEEGPVVAGARARPQPQEGRGRREEHYLRVGAALVLVKGTNAETFTEEIPKASDVLVDVLSEKTVAELSGPGAKTVLKEELTEKVKEAYEGKLVPSGSCSRPS